VIDDRGNAVVGRDGEELGPELLALADVDGNDLVREPGLLKKDRDLVAVRRGPVVKIHHDSLPVVVGNSI
jgi:hypothetical protein